MKFTYRFFDQHITDAQREESRNQYFVSHELSKRKIDDLRRAVGNALAPLGMQPYYADQEVQGQEYILSKICQKITLTHFGVFDLTSPSPNVLIELGIAVGLNRPCLLIAESDIIVPATLQGLVMQYASYSELASKLHSKVLDWLKAQSDHEHLFDTYCPICARLCGQIQAWQPQKQYLVVHGEDIPCADFHKAIEIALDHWDLKAVYLHDQVSSAPALCVHHEQLNAARFGVFCISDAPGPTVYLAFGIAIGMRVPWLFLAKKGMNIPTVLQGIDRFEFDSYLAIEQTLPEMTRSFLSQIELLPLETVLVEQQLYRKEPPHNLDQSTFEKREYTSEVLADGSLVVPSALRDILANATVVTRGVDKCLIMFPVDRFQELADRIRELPMTQQEGREFARHFFAGASDCEIGEDGRIVLPDNLWAYAGIQAGKNATLVKVFDRVEIFADEVWDEVLEVMSLGGLAGGPSTASTLSHLFNDPQTGEIVSHMEDHATQRCQVQRDGSFIMPATLSDRFSGQIILTRGPGPSLIGVDQVKWNELEQRIKAMPMTQGEGRLLSRLISVGARMVSMMPDGRLKIPEDLRTYAGIGNELILINKNSRIELWANANWRP